MLRDLDSLAYPENPANCPETEIEKLLKGKNKSNNLLLRFAVAEAENWLLADYNRLSKFLSSPSQKHINPDQILNGKEKMIELARSSKNRQYREDMLPPANSAKPGPRYNEILTKFIHDHWNPKEAAKHSKSLRNTLNRLKKFPNP